MPASRAAARRAVSEPLSNESPPCEQAQALREQTAVAQELVAELRTWRETFKPAADAVVGFEARLDALCKWLRRWGPLALASAPGVLVAIGAISPNAASALKAFLTGAP